jgi:hypothetical protein
LPTTFQQRSIHSPLPVIKNPQIRDLFRQGLAGSFRVALPHPQQHNQAEPNPAHDFFAYSDFRTLDPLHHCSHRREGPPFHVQDIDGCP